jgi:hypothetical protein
VVLAALFLRLQFVFTKATEVAPEARGYDWRKPLRMSDGIELKRCTALVKAIGWQEKAAHNTISRQRTEYKCALPSAYLANKVWL